MALLRKGRKGRVPKTARRSRRTKNLLDSAFPVVGIGASAGGLSAVTELLKNLPPRIGIAVVVIQHLDPKHGSLTADILSRASAMPVAEVRDGMRIEPGRVYVIPPNRNLQLVRGILKLSPRSEIRGQHLPIDFFFQSLAEDKKDLAIGVVLSGIASDGTMGLRAIKSEGGVTFAQDPKTAQYDGMPRSAILSGAVDIVESPRGIAEEIGQIAHLLPGQPVSVVTDRGGVGRQGQLRKIFAVLRNATGVDFTYYKQSTIQRRIARRQFLIKTPDLQSYARYLADHPAEVKSLFEDLLIQVTSFFRDPEAFEFLKSHVLPKYLKDWDRSVPIRIWVAGCSTGEEAYSIAMVFLELLEQDRDEPQFQIFASDISEHAIQNARKGVYPENIAKDVGKVRLRRFFERTQGGYRIAKSVRDRCLFSKQDLTSDPPFAKIDLISCRNVLIYLTVDLQKRVFPIFHYALNPGGILWLGRSEAIGQFSNLFTVEDRTNKFYSKKQITTPVRMEFPVGHQVPEPLSAATAASRKMLEPASTLADVQREADRVALNEYAPPGVVINDGFEILQVRGRPAPYLELAAGQASLNLFKLARPEIVSDLRYLISAAREQNKPAKKDGLSLKGAGGIGFGIRVVPLRLPMVSRERCFLIFFERAAAFIRSDAPAPRISDRKQMVESQEYHQALIEEYETTQEELTSANEELQSTNEELQSTNEELETAKEELQSANEEMTTVNDELQTRNAEMTQISNDLTNILSSVDIPIVMVGHDGRIRSFTARAGQILKLIPSDIGRPVGDVKPHLQVGDLDELTSSVMTTMSPREIETQDKQGTWFRVQVKPYRTLENKIDGAVIALIDITALKHSSERLQRVGEDAAMIMETTPTPILVITPDRRVHAANESFCETFKVERSETEGRFLSELGAGQWSIAPLLKMLEAVLSRGEQFKGFEVELDFPVVGHKCLLINARRSYLAGAEMQVALFAIEDITVRKETALQLEKARSDAEKANRVKDQFLATLSHELRTPLTTILSWAQILRLGAVDPEKARKGVVVIERSAQAQRQLIDDLLDVSRIQSGKLQLQFLRLDPAECVSAAVESERSLAEEKGIQMVTEFDSACGKMNADPDRLQQVLRNLLWNAVKFTPRGGRITVRLKGIKEKSREFIQFQVKDTGKGIKAEFLPFLFQRFTQEDSSASRRYGGLGLGLSIVRHLVEMHGGTVKAESRGEGKGAIFTLTLPREQARTVEAAEKPGFQRSVNGKPAVAERLDGLRVLIVDDQEDTRDGFAVTLQSFGAVVRTAGSAADGFDSLREFKPDVLLCDIAMPEEDGYSLMRRIRKLKPNQGGKTPAIAVTAYAAAEDVRRAFEVKFDLHLAKPVDMVVLSHSIANLAKPAR